MKEETIESVLKQFPEFAKHIAKNVVPEGYNVLEALVHERNVFIGCKESSDKLRDAIKYLEQELEKANRHISCNNFEM